MNHLTVIRRLVATAAFLLLSWHALAQHFDTTGCYQREPMPLSVCRILSVGVDTTEERIRLTWQVNGSEGVAGYCICAGSPCLALDTLWSVLDTTYVVLGHAVDEIHQYSLFAIDSCLHGGEMIEAASNIVLHAEADSCSRTVHFTWNAAAQYTSAVRYKLWLWTDTELLADSTSSCSLTVQLNSSTMHLRARLEAMGDGVSAWSNGIETFFRSPDECEDDPDTSEHPIPTIAADPFVPNCFTPMLSTNSCFRPVFPSTSTPDEYTLRIYNRIGSLVYQTRDVTDCWNGAYRGEMLPQDTYVYYLTYRFADDLRQLSGTVLLMR